MRASLHACYVRARDDRARRQRDRAPRARLDHAARLCRVPAHCHERRPAAARRSRSTEASKPHSSSARAPACSLQLSEPMVSRRHFSVEVVRSSPSRRRSRVDERHVHRRDADRRRLPRRRRDPARRGHHALSHSPRCATEHAAPTRSRVRQARRHEPRDAPSLSAARQARAVERAGPRRRRDRYGQRGARRVDPSRGSARRQAVHRVRLYGGRAPASSSRSCSGTRRAHSPAPTATRRGVFEQARRGERFSSTRSAISISRCNRSSSAPSSAARSGASEAPTS